MTWNFLGIFMKKYVEIAGLIKKEVEFPGVVKKNSWGISTSWHYTKIGVFQ